MPIVDASASGVDAAYALREDLNDTTMTVRQAEFAASWTGLTVHEIVSANVVTFSEDALHT